MYSNTIADFISFNREKFDPIMDLMPIPVFIKNRAGLYIECNRAFNDFLAISREDIIGKSVYDIWNKKEADMFFSQDEALFSQGGVQIYETMITTSKGVTHTVQFHKQIFNDSFGETAGFLGVIFDITEKKKLESDLEKLAILDDLTGLSNRREGMNQLEIIHEVSEQNKRPYCLAMIDIDCFKHINDQYGHHNGDVVLREFADLTKKILRCNDLCFRYGGEEFVIILPETALNDGFAIVECLRKTWASCRVSVSQEQFIQSTISIGITQYDKNCISYKKLLQISDKALYLAKNGGKNCSVCIQSDMNDI